MRDLENAVARDLIAAARAHADQCTFKGSKAQKEYAQNIAALLWLETALINTVRRDGKALVEPVVRKGVDAASLIDAFKHFAGKKDADPIMLYAPTIWDRLHNKGIPMDWSALGMQDFDKRRRLVALPIEGLKDAYIEAAAELQSKKASLQADGQEVDHFVMVRDALLNHPDFEEGSPLPTTYFSGSDLDPQGQEPAVDQAMADYMDKHRIQG
jgi:hypothetical protein